ncbi:unnamed protein product [Amoebophrya sp. A25]|nr:unnamed protein product [Amoebophrya sp. A25]|eukprot:GSA25T00006316001.1
MLSNIFKVCALAALVDARQKYSPRQTAFTQTAEQFLAAADAGTECKKVEKTVLEKACGKEVAEKQSEVKGSVPKDKDATKDEDVKAACCAGSCGSSCR